MKILKFVIADVLFAFRKICKGKKIIEENQVLASSVGGTIRKQKSGIRKKIQDDQRTNPVAWHSATEEYNFFAWSGASVINKENCTQTWTLDSGWTGHMSSLIGNRMNVSS